ncbi:MAG: guanylate kinase [Flavobacteriales bacterium]|nr:MAG: guanylate kinase [Flavobacteriales bacterium]
MQGKAIIISAPSGSGKTTIVHHLLKQDFGLAFSVSATSRPKRQNETEGKDYYFISEEEFRTKIENNEFVEWEEVYNGQFYGTLKSEIERVWATGNHVVFDVDVVGGLNLKKQFGEQVMAVFVMVPSIEELKTRLQIRATEPPEKLASRLSKAEQEMQRAKEFDKVIVNDDLPHALRDAEVFVKEFL